MSTRDNTRILLVDDRESVRRGLRMRLALEPGLTVVGEATCGPEAVRAAAATRPHVVVMDVVMPDGDGIDATVAILEHDPAVRVVVLSIHDDPATRAAAAAAGATAFVTKHQPPADLLDVIHRVVG